MIGLAIAPLFPALMSGTSQQVGDACTANTMGFQRAMTGLGGAIIPSLVGVLAKATSLEIVPICLTVLFTALIPAYGFIQPLAVSQKPTR